MSHTQSRGYHTARKWTTPATALCEALERKAGTPLTPEQVGAAMAMERLFSLALEGLADVRRTDTICATSIMGEVYKRMGKDKLNLSDPHKSVSDLYALVREMRVKSRVCRSIDERMDLIEFLDELSKSP